MDIALDKIEEESHKDSIIHNIDGRVKIIFTIIIIVYAVYTTNIFILLALEMYLLIIIIFSKVSLKGFTKRLLLLLPFGGFLAIFQPFIKHDIPLYTLPLGITIGYDGILFGTMLLFRLIVCLTTIIILSSVTPLEKIINSMRKLGFPKEMAMMFSLTIRYLFVFFEEFETTTIAQKSRSFSIWNKKTKYIWRIKQLAYTILTLFLKSFEKGEKVYYSMLSRGYVGETVSLEKETSIRYIDFSIIILTIILISSVEIANLIGII